MAVYTDTAYQGNNFFGVTTQHLNTAASELQVVMVVLSNGLTYILIHTAHRDIFSQLSYYN